MDRIVQREKRRIVSGGWNKRAARFRLERPSTFSLATAEQTSYSLRESYGYAV